MAQTLNYTIQTSGVGGETINWTVNGSNLSAIYTGATSGSLTVAGDGSASISFNLTTNNTAITATFTVTFDGGVCDTQSDTVVVSGTGTPDPADERTEFCQITTIPYVFCPVYDGNGDLKSLNVKQRIKVYEAPVGGIAVPTGLTVNSSGNIVSTGTINVEGPGIGAAGFDVEVITSGWISQGTTDPTITGTTTTIRAIGF